MRLARFFCLVAVAGSSAFGQGQGSLSAPANEDSREALIKRSLARDRGEITVMEASSRDGGGVIIGYSSGAILNCYGNESCREFEGTPSSTITGAVREIVISRRGDQEIIWAAYPHGVFYQCIHGACREFTWSGTDDE